MTNDVLSLESSDIVDVNIPEGTILMGDLRKLVNNPESSDIIFLCKDGVEVHACRLLLVVRSSFFRKMLQNGMAESGKSTVALPTVESSVFVVVLKYLYTAELSEEDLSCVSCKLDWSLLMKVLVAARFLMLDRFHRDILERLRKDLPAKLPAAGVWHTESEQTEIVLKLSALCDHPHLLGDMEEGMNKSLDELGNALVDVLASEDLSPIALSSLSIEGLNYYLIKTRKVSYQDADEFSEWSLDEYLKLRKILLWCAVRNISPSDVVSFHPVCLPGSGPVIQYLQGNEKPNQIFSTVGARTLSVDRETVQDLVNASEKKVLKFILEKVELSYIHPELLLSVIKPLEIIDPELLSKAFAKQAVTATWWVKKLKISSEQKFDAGYREQAERIVQWPQLIFDTQRAFGKQAERILQGQAFSQRPQTHNTQRQQMDNTLRQLEQTHQNLMQGFDCGRKLL